MVLRTALHVVRLAGRWVLRGGLALAIVILAFIGIGPRTGAYRTLTVLTGSMRPAMPPGSLAVDVPVQAASLRVGDVISYQTPIPGHPVVTHRIVSILHGGPDPVIRTKGDANAVRDPWTARLVGPVAWQRVAVVPYLGSVINALRQPLFHRATVYGAPALLVAVVFFQIWAPATGAGGDGSGEDRPGADAEAEPVRRRRLVCLGGAG